MFLFLGPGPLLCITRAAAVETSSAAQPGAATAGVKATEHWAFQPIQDPALPRVTNATWAKTGVDCFILAGIERAGLVPARPVSKRGLLRRVTFDLTGLPPTPAEVDAFLQDTSSEAFAKVVERLLASPRYGERWGRHWLDAARYADSNGMDENLAYASAWRYRDYVVAAFNRDKPYDRFLREQLAGDLLPHAATAADDPGQEAIVATGFLCIGPKMLAEDDPMKMEMDLVDEQLDTTSRVFMGLTVGCGRCHDHKYDPVSTQDYYAMAGIFKSTRTMENFKVVARWQERPLGTPNELERWTAGRRRIAETTNRVSTLIERANRALLREARGRLGEYLLAAQEERDREQLLSTLPPPGHQAGLVPEFVHRWADRLKAEEHETNSVLAAWRGMALARGEWPAQTAALLGQAPAAGLDEAARRYTEASHRIERAWEQITKQTTTNVSAAGPEARPEHLPDPTEEQLRVLLYDPKGPFALPKNAEDYYPTGQLAELRRAREELQGAERELTILPEAMAVADGVPQDLRVHKRGSHLTLGERTPRGFLPSIGAPTGVCPKTNSSGRLELADWMANAEHPLTARVMVNRIWHWHFGEGLVRSPDNFGRLGESPTHPQLLDWLATRFLDSGWSVKAMHRLILASATYQQASEPAVPVDPENKLWAHFSRRRLEAETIRDSILAVSGGLDLRMGGPTLTAKNREYVTGTGSKIDPALFESPRRSLYLPVVRSALYDVFQVFDFADPSVLNGRRDQTTVAPQALFMLNSRLVAESAQRLADHFLADPWPEDSARVAALYQLAYGRLPAPDETAQALAYLDRYLDVAGQRPDSGQPWRRRAWQSLCRTLIAASEFIYLD
ncbi:MAG TPA: DUF1549 and DUF1553 domain-containing protein [Verrucomicrobiae bacterium]|nr:DUF1549 and DUF1553 domain-containing protein [Verrucomicrobiae bacterium]